MNQTEWTAHLMGLVDAACEAKFTFLLRKSYLNTAPAEEAAYATARAAVEAFARTPQPIKEDGK